MHNSVSLSQSFHSARLQWLVLLTKIPQYAILWRKLLPTIYFIVPVNSEAFLNPYDAQMCNPYLLSLGNPNYTSPIIKVSSLPYGLLQCARSPIKNSCNVYCAVIVKNMAFVSSYIPQMCNSQALSVITHACCLISINIFHE